MTKALDIQAREAEFVLQTYKRQPVVFVKGAGTRLEDIDGKVYLDFISGIGVSVLGHAHPALTAAVADQTAALIHTSNLYYHPLQGQVAARLATLSGLQRSFFCNSGTEAMEACLKFARRYWFTQGVRGRTRYVAFEHGFSGRSMGALSVTANPHYREPFEPLIPGVTFVAPGDIAALEAAVTDQTAAIVVEPIQGEGGYIVPPDGFLAGLRSLCDEHGILLIFDDVQSGVGRTGRMYAADHWGVRPDIMTTAKGLGSGLPTGAVVAKRRVIEQWKRGAHGNTYGGNPVTCAAAIATLDLVQREYAANAARTGTHFMQRLHGLARDYPCIGEVRGKGLMIGMELIEADAERTPARALCEAIVTRAYHNGLLLLSCGTSTVRFMPPLSVSEAEIDEAVALLRMSLDEALAGRRA